LQFFSKNQLSRGDVVVFHFSNQKQIQYVKRIIGLPGDSIEFQGDFLKINGQLLDYVKINDLDNNPNPESFAIFQEKGLGLDHTLILSQPSKSLLIDKKAEPLKVPEGQIYVLGDNRDTSDDSRYWGTVPIENISGQVKLIWMSFEPNGQVRWKRIFQSVH
jgi:signal peptidase I